MKGTAMSTTSRTRKAAGKTPAKTPKELVLPDSATTVTLGGATYCIIPESDMRDWLEDLEDSIAAREALDEPGESIPFDEVVKELGLKLPPRGKK